MPRRRYNVIVNNNPQNKDMEDLVIQLNRVFLLLTDHLQKIEGFDGRVSEFYGDIEHKDSAAKIGLYGVTKVAQQDHIADAETSHGSATTTELDALGSKINEILVAIENIGIVKSS